MRERGELINNLYDEPENIQKWHPRFDITSESLEDIPMIKLNSIPNHTIMHSSKSLTEFLKNTDFHQNTIQQAISITN